MQPVPTANSTESSQTTDTETANNRQYGSSDFLAGSPRPNNEQFAGAQQNAVDDDPVQPEDFTEAGLQVRRVSTTTFSTPLKSSAQRISDHENAFSPSPQRSEYEGPGFKVVKRKSSRPDAPQLDKFPNEVLTHILSHLPASSLSTIALVSQRFYSLVTTPHAWRVAFSRYFPGQDAIDEATPQNTPYYLGLDEARDVVKSEQRFFTRLTALASWRSEYVLRTRLLRSLARGKPTVTATSNTPGRSIHGSSNPSSTLTYNSQLFTTINHIHAHWNNGKKDPRFIHGADDYGHVCSSDAGVGKVDAWGLNDPQALPQFSDLFPGDAMYGLSPGRVIGVPNVMDISQPHGMVYGEGFPGGLAYFRAPDEMRGRFLASSLPEYDHALGIPAITQLNEAICSVWIAKSKTIPAMTSGLVGILTGSSCGVITAYSLGHDSIGDARLVKAEITAKWMLSPGVPIIAFAVDESYDTSRRSAARIWAVALNALGEVFYLDTIPERVAAEKGVVVDDKALAQTAWQTGRSAYWNFAEPSRREARDDTYREFEYDGSYSPRSSATAMRLSRQQIVAETQEIEKFLSYRPSHFHKICHGWDMRRRLEVDFGGDDFHGAGENIVVVSCGNGDDTSAQLKRYTRLKVEQESMEHFPAPMTPPMMPRTSTMASLFGGGKSIGSVGGLATPASSDFSSVSGNFFEEWRTSALVMPNKASEITTSGIDMSTFALLTAMEDPILSVIDRTDSSTPTDTPGFQAEGPMKPVSDVPGYRSRLLAVGTTVGSLVLWNMRAATSSNTTLISEIQPLRIIHTNSPQITCLALSSLYLVHGGSDGLVQTWDPLASTMQPVRTLHSKHSSRARRRLAQAEASVHGVGINLFAAGAIAIDPDPSVLRGMVSLGTYLRYWSYSSNGADQISSKKRQLRKSSERGNNGGDRFVSTGRGILMDYIANEQVELQQEKERSAREDARLRGRFGLDFADMSEEEALRYAELISQETFEQDQQRKASGFASHTLAPDDIPSGLSLANTPARNASTASMHTESSNIKNDDELNDDIEAAIRLSLLDGLDQYGSPPASGHSSAFEIPVKYKQKKSRRSPLSSPPSSLTLSQRRTDSEVDDLEFALQLSLAEDESRKANVGVHDEDEFPVMVNNGIRSKGKARGV